MGNLSEMNGWRNSSGMDVEEKWIEMVEWKKEKWKMKRERKIKREAKEGKKDHTYRK